MRFVLSEDFWVLDALNPVEWHFICELPAAAGGKGLSSDDRDARLYPSPVAEESADEPGVDEQLEDWRELIQPEIEELFQENRDKVVQDIDAGSPVDAAELFDPETLEEMEEAGVDSTEYRRVMVPIDHTDSWYGTLNQARILMNEAHDISESMDRFAVLMGGEEEIDPDRAMMLAQYEMYSAIQSILVENVMS